MSAQLERINARTGDAVEHRLYVIGKPDATSNSWVTEAVRAYPGWTLAASLSAKTMSVYLPDLKEGDVIEGYHLLGQIESGGNTATLDAALRTVTPAAAAVVDAAVAGTSMTQISVSADTSITEANSAKVFQDFQRYKVVDTAIPYLKLTGTTAASTDIDLLGAVVYVRPAR